MKYSKLILLYLIIIILLLLRFYFYFRHLSYFRDDQMVKLNTTIVTEPKIKNRIQSFSTEANGTRFYVTTAKYPLYSYGEKLDIEGKLRVSENDRRRVYYTLLFPKINKAQVSANPLLITGLFIRRKAILLTESVFSPIDAALLLGIVFGIKQNMPDGFLMKLQDAGVIHVIAASGMNVSMVAGALFFTFKRFVNRKTAIVISIAGVMLYVFIAGFEASVIRAAIMAGMAFGAGVSGRQKLPLYSLFSTAFVMLLIYPSWLWEIGFQLSFLATIGILIGKPILDRGLVRLGKAGVLGEHKVPAGLTFLADDFTTTLSAQIATTPLLLSSFGSINLMSLVINALVLWTIPILMAIGALSVMIGLIFTQLGEISLYLAIPFLRYFEIVVVWFDRFKLPLSLENASWTLWLGYYLLLISAVLFVKKRKEP